MKNPESDLSSSLMSFNDSLDDNPIPEIINSLIGDTLITDPFLNGLLSKKSSLKITSSMSSNMTLSSLMTSSMSSSDFLDEMDSLKSSMLTIELEFLFNIRVMLINYEKLVRSTLYEIFNRNKRMEHYVQQYRKQYSKRYLKHNSTDDLWGPVPDCPVVFSCFSQTWDVECDEHKSGHYQKIIEDTKNNYHVKKVYQSLFGKDTTDLYSWDMMEYRNPFID